MNKMENTLNTDLIALFLRIGLGTVFIIGGTYKLGLLLDSSTTQAMVDNYMSTSGYINALFQEFLFTGSLGNVITPFGFLTALSAFELISGIALVIGLMVKPLSLFYAFLLWTFVIALPTMTVPGVEISEKTYTSPAIFVQIRDIALSGMMFVLFNLGAGLKSVDGRFNIPSKSVNWDQLGLLLRLSLAATMIVAGIFGGFAKVPNFNTADILLTLTGLVLVFGNQTMIRAAGGSVVLIMAWYMIYKLNFDNSVIKNLNGFKREFALMAGGLALAYIGGGSKYTLSDIWTRSKLYLAQYKPSPQS